jgi:hypothetical protein
MALCVAVACSAAAFGGDGPAMDSPLVVVEAGVAGGVADRLVLDMDVYDQLRDAGHVTLLGFDLAGVFVDLDVERFDVFAADAEVIVASAGGQEHVDRPDVVLLRGEVDGEPGSSVFLGLGPNGSNGYVMLGKDTYVISTPVVEGGGETLVYNLTTLPEGMITWTPFECMVRDAPVLAVDVSDGSTRDDPPCRVIKLAVETDWEFTGTLFGGDTDASAAYAAHLIGAVSEIYRRDLNCNFNIVFLRIWADSNDPWTQGDMGAQLTEFTNYWVANMGSVSRHLAHFLSGRPLGGGVAFLPGVCSGRWGYGLSSSLSGHFPYPLLDNHNQNWDPYVVSHEMGHNVGAPHTHDVDPKIDNCAGGDCISNGTIMSYCHGCPGGMRNIQLRFHDRTVNESILPHLDATCDMTAEPVQIFVQPESQDVCEDASASLTVLAIGDDLQFQWYHNGGPIPGATEFSYTIDPVTPGDGGLYYVDVYNHCGSAFSDMVTLTVSDCCPADFNGDTTVNSQDFTAFLNAFVTGDPSADFDGDGMVNSKDFMAFLNAFVAGC